MESNSHFISKMQRVKLIGHEKSLFFIHSYGDLILLSFGVINLNGVKIAPEVVRQAMECLQKRHPTLRAFLEQDLATADVIMCLSEDLSDREFMRPKLNWKTVTSRAEMLTVLEASSKEKFAFGQRKLMWKCEAVEFGEQIFKIR
jgi:hypothetical protein